MQLKCFTAQQFRDFTDQPSRLANEQALEPGKAINQTEADIADKPQNIRSVGEQAIETISGNAHRHRVEAPPTLIAFEHIDGSRIEPKARRVDDDLGERGDIL